MRLAGSWSCKEEKILENVATSDELETWRKFFLKHFPLYIFCRFFKSFLRLFDSFWRLFKFFGDFLNFFEDF